MPRVSGSTQPDLTHIHVRRPSFERISPFESDDLRQGHLGREADMVLRATQGETSRQGVDRSMVAKLSQRVCGSGAGLVVRKVLSFHPTLQHAMRAGAWWRLLSRQNGLV